jgi:hypothetical protein
MNYTIHSYYQSIVDTLDREIAQPDPDIMRVTCQTSAPATSRLVFQLRLLLDSRVVDVPRSSTPTFGTSSFWKPFFFNGLQKAERFLGAKEA